MELSDELKKKLEKKGINNPLLYLFEKVEESEEKNKLIYEILKEHYNYPLNPKTIEEHIENNKKNKIFENFETKKKILPSKNGVYEIISDLSFYNTKFINFLIKNFSKKYKIFYLSNTVIKKKDKKENIFYKSIFDIKELNIFLSFFLEKLKKNDIKNPILIIDHFSAIVYEMKNLQAFFFIMIEIVKIFKIIKEKFFGIIIISSIPKKSGNQRNFKNGGILNNPWRNFPDKFFYLEMTESSFTDVIVIDKFKSKIIEQKILL